MKNLGPNISKNKLGLAFCLLILVYMAILYPQLPQLRFAAAAVPFIFITLASIFALLKIILFLTQSPALKKLDELSFIKIEMPEDRSGRSAEKESPQRAVAFIVSIFLFLGMVYWLGFLFSTLIFAFVFTYLPTRKIFKSIIVCLVLTAVTYLFSCILPGNLWQGILFGA